MTAVAVRVGSVAGGDLDEGRLTADERSRAAGYRLDEDRDRFVASANLLRDTVAAELGTDRFVVTRTCVTCSRPHGRPRVPGTDLEVSLAHRGDVIVVATSWRIAVGVDVEHSDAVDDRAYDIVASEAERRHGADAEHRARVWARSEAILKATGTGFARDPREVTAAADGTVIWAGSGPAARWVDLAIGDLVGSGYVAAAAWLSGWGCDVHVRAAPRLAVGPGS